MIGDTQFKLFNVLFICAHNSARSILAEALLNRLGAGRFEAYSAGIDPVPAISPFALSLLHKINYNTGTLYTKDLGSVADKAEFDLIIRLSPELPANGRLPEFARHVPVVDWFMANPCDVSGTTSHVASVYADVFNTLANRLDMLSKMSDATLRGPRVVDILERHGEDYLRMAG